MVNARSVLQTYRPIALVGETTWHKVHAPPRNCRLSLEQILHQIDRFLIYTDFGGDTVVSITLKLFTLLKCSIKGMLEGRRILRYSNFEELGLTFYKVVSTIN